MDTLQAYAEHARLTMRELGIPASILAERPRELFIEGTDLVSIGLDMFNREQRLERQAAAQWTAMREAAAVDGIILGLISAFRSFDYQRGIITRKLAAGQSLTDILSASALPGYSEHHTGQAVDIGVPGEPPLTEAFEQSPAFAWLQRRAGDFGFRLSFPRDNTAGYIYEPWHWRWHAGDPGSTPRRNN